MMANCARFIDRRCEDGGWPSYVQLEALLEKSYYLALIMAGSVSQSYFTVKEAQDLLDMIEGLMPNLKEVREKIVNSAK